MSLEGDWNLWVSCESGRGPENETVGSDSTILLLALDYHLPGIPVLVLINSPSLFPGTSFHETEESGTYDYGVSFKNFCVSRYSCVCTHTNSSLAMQ